MTGKGLRLRCLTSHQTRRRGLDVRGGDGRHVGFAPDPAAPARVEIVVGPAIITDVGPRTRRPRVRLVSRNYLEHGPVDRRCVEARRSSDFIPGSLRRGRAMVQKTDRFDRRTRAPSGQATREPASPGRVRVASPRSAPGHGGLRIGGAAFPRSSSGRRQSSGSGTGQPSRTTPAGSTSSVACDTSMIDPRVAGGSDKAAYVLQNSFLANIQLVRAYFGVRLPSDRERSLCSARVRI
jgi:hypothetical protein